MMMMMMMIIYNTDAQNAMENVENKILEVLEDVGEKMAPVIKVVMRKMMIIITMNFLPQKIMFQTCTLTAGGLETKLMHDAYISFIHLWKFFTLAQNWRDIVFKNIDQDFLLKTTNLMTYAARDKNSLLNFLDENLVIAFHLRLFQMTFSGAFERQPDRRQFPTDPCRHLGELCTGGQNIHHHLHFECLFRPWRRRSTCASRTRSPRPTSRPSQKLSKSSAISSMATSRQGTKLSPG